MCFFGALLVRLYSIQIERHEEFAQKVPEVKTRIARVPGVRGEIRDVLGNVLVENDLTYELLFDFNVIVDYYRKTEGPEPVVPYIYQDASGRKEPRTAPDMAKIINKAILPELNKVIQDLEPFNASAMLAHWKATNGLVPYSYPMELNFQQFASIAESSLDIRGVTPSARPKRHYKYGALASHILGYVNVADIEKSRPADWKDFSYYVPDDVGIDGLEKRMDAELRGKPGKRKLKFDEKGKFVKEEGFEPPVSGSDVYLTIDTDIQYITEMALRKIHRGAAVVIDPNTGNILAMASVPSFDPQKFIPAIEREDWLRYTENYELAPMLNRAVKGFAPGSIFKIPVAFAGMLEGVDRRSFYCSGALYYGNLRKRCWIDGKGVHGSLTVKSAIKSSCNTFFYQYGNAAGINRIQEAADIFGLGEKTGIQVTGEVPGRIPGPKYLRRQNKGERWGEAHTANVAIGQGDTECTPLQMASVVATVANRGICFQPRLVDRVISPSGVISDPHPVTPRHRLSDFGITDAQIETVRRGMWEVVNDGGGTARRARSKITEISGKTGTAQFERNQKPDNHAWFAGFAPYDQPKFAVCVFVQGGKSGGGVAAPIMRKIVEDGLILLKNRKDNENIKPIAKPIKEAEGSFDFTELVSFDETLSPDALGDESDVGSVGEVRETIPIARRPTSQSKPKVRDLPDSEGSRKTTAPPKKTAPRKAFKIIPRSSDSDKRNRRGLFNRNR